MFSIYCDGLLIYDTSYDNNNLLPGSIELELNKTGSFSFTIYPEHFAYGLINKLKTIIEVYRDDVMIFRGRVLDDELGFHNEKQVICEGELAFLLDSIQRPYDYSGTIAGYFAQLIANHNSQVDASKKIAVGNITVQSETASFSMKETEYMNTWESIQKKLIDIYGGYIWIRHESNGNFIDYLSDFSSVSSQTITFGKNLLDMKRTSKGEDIVTAIIPLGAKLEGTDERLTIKSVNNNVDYVHDPEAVSLYGWIFAVQIWDEITSASILKSKGQSYLNEQKKMLYEVEFTAADLSAIDRSIDSFMIGTYVNIESSIHFGSGVQQLLVKKLSIDLLNPANNTITIGEIQSGLINNVKHDEEIILNNVKGMISETKGAIESLHSTVTSEISQSASAIMTSVSETYYTKDAQSQYAQSVSTQFTQTETNFTFLFNQVDGKVTDMQQYIRFENGNIILGESGNELTLKIENDQITFFDGFEAVAYFSNGKLYVTDGEFTNSLRLGDFAFNPRSNGNLSLAKVV